MSKTFQPEDFSVADVNFYHRLGFSDNEIKRGLYSEQVNDGAVETESIGTIRSI